MKASLFRQCIISEEKSNQINTHYDETKKKAHESQVARSKVEPWLAQPKASHQPTNESFMSGPPLSLRPDQPTIRVCDVFLFII